MVEDGELLGIGGRVVACILLAVVGGDLEAIAGPVAGCWGRGRSIVVVVVD